MTNQLKYSNNSREEEKLNSRASGAGNCHYPQIVRTRLYKTKELPEISNFTISYFEAARVRGGGPEFIRCGKRAIRYSGQSIVDWLDAGRASNTAQADNTSQISNDARSPSKSFGGTRK